jgi:hypothetical protein
MAGRKLSSAKVALARQRREKSSSCIGAQLNHRRSNAQHEAGGDFQLQAAIVARAPAPLCRRS